jgi:hypothetical protein
MLREFTEAHPKKSVVLDFHEDAEDDSGNALASAPKKRKQRRTNEFISKRQAINLIAAFEFAEAIGLPLNVSVDISWIFFAGTADDRTRFARCQQRLSKWARRQAFPLTMIWTREVGKNGWHPHPRSPPRPFPAHPGWHFSTSPRTLTRTRRWPHPRQGHPHPGGLLPPGETLVQLEGRRSEARQRARHPPSVPRSTFGKACRLYTEPGTRS